MKFVRVWLCFHHCSIQNHIGNLKVKYWYFIIQPQLVLDIKLWVNTLHVELFLIFSFSLLSNQVHCGSIRQTAQILSMSQDCLRTGDKAKVHFRFIKNPEYLNLGMKLIFREGRTKAIGTVTKLLIGAAPRPYCKMKRSHQNPQ